MSKMRVAVLGGLFFLVSVLVVFWGQALSYRAVIERANNRGAVSGWFYDGWTASDLTLQVEGLAKRGNRLELHFNEWRPAEGTARIGVSVCGENKGEWAVTGESPMILPISGSCEPRTVGIKTLNPFQVSGDDRQLGFKLDRFKITSKLGVPLLAPLKLLVASLMCLFSMWGAWLLSSPGWTRGLVALVPASVLVFSLRSTVDEVGNLTALWALVTCMIWGATGAKLHPFKGAGREDAGSSISMGEWIAIILIVAVAFSIRCYGLNFGLPGYFHPDETPKINAISRMITAGNLNPKYFLHPSLLLYSTLGMYKLFDLFGYSGEIHVVGRLAGRTVSMLAGTGTIFVLFLVGRRLFTPFVGLLAAAMLAVFPLHITSSRYLKEDALMTFLAMLVALMVIKAVQTGKGKHLFFGAAFAGLAFGTKYTGCLTAMFVAAAPWLRSRSIAPDPKLFKAAFLSGGIFILFFLIATPYSVLDFPTFLGGISNERKHMIRGHTVAIDAWSQLWMYHLWRSIFPGAGLFPCVVAMLGLGLAAYRRRWEDLFIVGGLLLFYLPAEWVKAKPAPQPERYIFPCLPFVALLAAESVRVVANSQLRKIVPVLALALVSFPVVKSVGLAREIRYDTRQQMADWMSKHLPHGSRVLVDWQPYAPAFHKGEFKVGMFPSGKMIQSLNPNWLKTSGNDYLVLSSLVYNRFFKQPKGDGARRSVLRRAFTEVPIIKQIRPKSGTYGFHNPVLTVFSLKREEFAKLESELARKGRGELSQTSNEVRASLRWK